MTEPLRRIRRFVTGHDPNGVSVLLSADAPPQHHDHPGPEATGVELFEIWNTSAMPAPIDLAESKEPNDRPLRIQPPANGTILRLVDFHPGHTAKTPDRGDGRPPGTHRTESVDYAVLLEGEIYLVLDREEVRMLPGDVAVQRGTDHAWENRSDRVARIAFVLIDGRFTPNLRACLPNLEHEEAAVDILLK